MRASIPIAIGFLAGIILCSALIVANSIKPIGMLMALKYVDQTPKADDDEGFNSPDNNKVWLFKKRHR